MKKKSKRRSFARRLTRRIALSQLIVMGLASYLIYETSKFIVNGEEFDLYKSYLSTSNSNVARVLTEVSTAAANRADEIEGNLDQPDKLVGIMKEVVECTPHIRSCGISFMPDYYPKKGRWFCPYAVRGEDGKTVQRIMGDSRHDYLKADWFKEAMKAEKGYWSKPFFDSSDSITPLVAYLMPIRDKQGKTVAVLGADLLLSNFSGRILTGIHYTGDSIHINFNNGKNEYVDSLRGDNINWDERKWRFVSFNFIIDKDGTFIAHPDNSRVIKDNYFDCAKETTDTIDDHVGRRMLSGEKGLYCNADGLPTHFDFFDINTVNVYMFYEPVEGTNWSIALAVPRLMIDGAGIGIGIVMLVLIALGMLVTRFIGRLVIKRAAKPLQQLALSADEVAKGNFSARLPRIKHNDEIQLLRDSFEGMQHSLTEYVEELKSTTASKAAIENELKVAHDIQMSMLPKTFPPYPERNDIDIYGSLKPAKDVGGDLFDFYIRNEQLFFCIGDVSGKGVPASLLMAVTRSLFRNISNHTAAPNHIAIALNDALADNNETSMFVTAFIGVLDLVSGRLTYCNAGHDAPLLADGHSVEQLSCDPNLPLGVMGGWTFTLQEIVLSPQTTIFLYTDGLNEAENAVHDQFGMERVTDVMLPITVSGDNRPDTIIAAMTEAVHRFVGDAEQSDDLTMLAIKYKKD